MKISDKIKAINEYFQSINCTDGVIYEFNDDELKRLFPHYLSLIMSVMKGKISLTHEYFTIDKKGLVTLSHEDIEEIYLDII